MSVTPVRWCPQEKERAGAEYSAANDTEIAEFGQELFEFEFNDGDGGDCRFRLANVTKPVGPASNVCDKVNHEVLESSWR